MIKKPNSVVLIFILILAVLLVWGIIGGSVAQDVGVSCDMGIGNSLCWKWHTNALGEINEFLNNLGSG